MFRLSSTACRRPLGSTLWRGYSTKPRPVIHEIPQNEKWKQDDLEGITNTKGKLSPTSSHLFKLILPMSNNHPTVLLLHPSQPLSHVSQLIRSSLPFTSPSTTISFRGVSSHKKRPFQWSDSTELGDFMRDAARTSEFTICISKPIPKIPNNIPRRDPTLKDSNENPHSAQRHGHEARETHIQISIPTFTDRTRFLRTRLNQIQHQLSDMESLKARCDNEAHRGARHMALGGFGMLVVYWAGVARLTFWDYGWDTMEPVTYLSGLSTVIIGYLWFLYQGREVSYTSVLARSISNRREVLYKSQGLDIERYLELVQERKAIRAEITRIAQDYEGGEGDSAEQAEVAENEGKNDGNADSTKQVDDDPETKPPTKTLLELQDIDDTPTPSLDSKDNSNSSPTSSTKHALPDSVNSKNSDRTDKEFNTKLANNLKHDSTRKQGGSSS